MIRVVLTVACAALVAPFVVGAAAAAPQVVDVRVWPRTGPAQRATGVAIASNRVLTVAHVLDGGDRVEVIGADGVRRPGAVLRRDRTLDLALLAVRGLPARRVRGADTVRGLRVLVRRDGRVRDRMAVVRRRVSARLTDQPAVPRRPSLELAAGVTPGDSGAPVVTQGGRLVGLVYARSTRRGGTTYAVRGPGLQRLLRTASER